MASIARASQAALRSFLGPWLHDGEAEWEHISSKRLSLATTVAESEQTQPLTWSSTLRSVASIFHTDKEDRYKDGTVKAAERSPKRPSLKALSWNSKGPNDDLNEHFRSIDAHTMPSNHRSTVSPVKSVLTVRNRVRMRKSLDRLHAKIAETFTPSFKLNDSPSGASGRGSDSSELDESPPVIGMGLREEFDRSRAEREQRYREILGQSPLSFDLDESFPHEIRPLQPRPLHSKSKPQEDPFEDNAAPHYLEASALRYAIEAIERPCFEVIDSPRSNNPATISESEGPEISFSDAEWYAKPSFERIKPTNLLSDPSPTYLTTQNLNAGLTYDNALDWYFYQAEDAIQTTEIAWFSSDSSISSSNNDLCSFDALSDACLKTTGLHMNTNDEFTRGRTPTRSSHHPRGSSSMSAALPRRLKRHLSHSHLDKRYCQAEVVDPAESDSPEEALIGTSVDRLHAPLDERRNGSCLQPASVDQVLGHSLDYRQGLHPRDGAVRTRSAGDLSCATVSMQIQDYPSVEKHGGDLANYGANLWQLSGKQHDVDLTEHSSQIPGPVYLRSRRKVRNVGTPSKSKVQTTHNSTRLPRLVVDPYGLNRSTQSVVRRYRKGASAYLQLGCHSDEEGSRSGTLSGTETSSEFEMYPLD